MKIRGRLSHPSELTSPLWVLVAVGAFWAVGPVGCVGGDTLAPTNAGGSGGAGDCDPLDCQLWEECRDGRCQLVAGRCNGDGDCSPEQLCNAEHFCIASTGPCAGVDCSNHGACLPVSGQPSCQCDSGYVGESCELCDDAYVRLSDGRCLADPCGAEPCGEHAQCEPDLQNGSAECTCDEGYGGDGCDECADGFHVHGSSCVASILFALPMANSNGHWINLPVIGFDHDPDPGWSDVDCKNYGGLAFPYCYDQHTGTDFMLRGGFTTMDAGSTAVLAAAAGQVIDAHDGEFDRCRANIVTQQVECPGYPGITPPNYVKLLHVDGKQSWYWHLKKDSVLVVPGDSVECGDPLGRVGSSGFSSAPHLHFAVLTAAGVRVDPYAGPFSQPASHWVEQEGLYGLPGAECQ